MRRTPTLAPDRAREVRSVERRLHAFGDRMAQRMHSRGSSRGFTLVELMTVVVIVSVIAAIGLVSLRSRVFGSKSTEALAMIQSIRVAEERWKAENLQYLNASASGNWYPADPRL